MKPNILATLVGALAGGFLGAFPAFFLTVACGAGEAFCLVTNLLLGGGGATVGLLSIAALRAESPHRRQLIVALVLGVLCGAAGYLWLDYGISHADPPL